MCTIICCKEQFPNSFRETTLHMIYKGKGQREVLPNNRFIHSKFWLARTAEGCVVEEGLKGPLVKESSIYQIGGQPGHRAEELMFVVKSVIAKQRAEKKAIIIQCWDISKFFDKEMIEDNLFPEKQDDEQAPCEDPLPEAPEADVLQAGNRQLRGVSIANRSLRR